MRSSYTIPASSSPWNTSGSDYNKQLVHYAGNITNGANYTWCAAVAGSCSSATTDGAIAGSSICPKGWKLPTQAQYDALLSDAGIDNNSTGSSKIQGTPYNFPYAGFVNNGSLRYVGSEGDYWSSTAYDSRYAYALYFNSSSVFTDLNFRHVGLSVRCIAP